MVRVLNATFNNISAISWGSALLVKETGVPEKITDLCKTLANVIAKSCFECTSP